jgi:hypothetical protein
MGSNLLEPIGGKRFHSSTDFDLRTIPPAYHTIVALVHDLLVTKKPPIKNSNNKPKRVACCHRMRSIIFTNQILFLNFELTDLQSHLFITFNIFKLYTWNTNKKRVTVLPHHKMGLG